MYDMSQVTEIKPGSAHTIKRHNKKTYTLKELGSRNNSKNVLLYLNHAEPKLFVSNYKNACLYCIKYLIFLNPINQLRNRIVDVIRTLRSKDRIEGGRVGSSGKIIIDKEIIR